MSGFFDNHTIKLSCPKCGKSHPKTFGWICAYDHFACDCGGVIRLDEEKFTGLLREAERQIDTPC